MPDQFRTAPLWGVGQRLFFLHDGRTADLLQAIEAHSSQRQRSAGSDREVQRADAQQKQEILNFLRIVVI